MTKFNVYSLLTNFKQSIYIYRSCLRPQKRTDLSQSGLGFTIWGSSAGMVRAAPYTASETEKPLSYFGTERRPSKTRGPVGEKPSWNLQLLSCRKAPQRKNNVFDQCKGGLTYLTWAKKTLCRQTMGRLEIALHIRKSLRANSFSKSLFRASQGSTEWEDLMVSRTWFAVSWLKDETQK